MASDSAAQQGVRLVHRMGLVTDPLAALWLVIECVTCGQPITNSLQAWRCCPDHHDKYGPDEWECANCVLETHTRMAL